MPAASHPPRRCASRPHAAAEPHGCGRCQCSMVGR
jgi:hypothetical protein